MNRNKVYQELEAGMLRYSDYLDVPVMPNGEALVPIIATPNLTATPVRSDMREYTGADTYVRQGVLDRLEKASELLIAEMPGATLDVGYGYRALSVQTARFNTFRSQLEDQYSGLALLEAVHRLIAVPDVAGHPAGAAVDIHIVHEGKALDFGTSMWEFVPDTYRFSPFIGKVATKNRQLLTEVMTEAGFAPFNGEWWHFSYGDKEWAKYYAEPAAIYEQVEFRAPGVTDV